MREPYGFKEFKVKELFKLIPTSHYGNLKDYEIEDDTGEGTTPFVTTTVSNNGVKAYSKLEPNNEGNTITYSDTTTSEAIFYRPEPFIGRSHVQRMDPKFGLNREIAMYIITCIKKSAEGLYDYSHKFNRKRMGNTIITLPVTPEGTPDYEYMEDYIDHIKGEYVDKLEESHREEYHQLEALGLDDGAIELEEPYGYEEIELDNMFERVQTGYIGEGSYQENSQEEKTEEFSLPLLSAKYDNNGILFYGRPEEWRTYRNVLGVVTSGAVATGLVYAYKDYVSVRSTAYLLKMKNKEYKDNFKVLQYLATALEKTLFGRYTRDYAPIWGRILENKEKIKLPSTPEGTPDYEYMENYIKHIANTYRMNRRDEQEEEVRQLRELVQ